MHLQGTKGGKGPRSCVDNMESARNRTSDVVAVDKRVPAFSVVGLLHLLQFFLDDGDLHTPTQPTQVLLQWSKWHQPLC